MWLPLPGNSQAFLCSMVGASVVVSHILFADHTLIFCDAEPSQIANLRVILSRFEEVLGLHINLGKSELVPVGGVHNLEALVGFFGVWAVFSTLEIFGPSIKCKI